MSLSPDPTGVVVNATTPPPPLLPPNFMPPNSTDLKNALEQLNHFLTTATEGWLPHEKIRQFPLLTGDMIACVYHNTTFYITGTDIVRVLMFLFLAHHRPVQHVKKFEEGVFSDLRNLKPGVHATLEENRSEFLEYLQEMNCIRTLKRQKVFFWVCVPWEKLFNDALERDLKREALGRVPTTKTTHNNLTSLTNFTFPPPSNSNSPSPSPSRSPSLSLSLSPSPSSWPVVTLPLPSTPSFSLTSTSSSVPASPHSPLPSTITSSSSSSSSSVITNTTPTPHASPVLSRHRPRDTPSSHRSSSYNDSFHTDHVH
ncbi:homeodomain transcription factor ste12 [Coelomomyces lativittatus]|nr:homeodomain transcription factor ste12 [Coelomomyces lativittatus]